MRKSKLFYFVRNILVFLFKPFFEYERRNAVVDTVTYNDSITNYSNKELDRLAKL